jgi:DNA replication protein DnaC
VEARRRGVSLYLYGGEGTGKTGAGVVIVKEARHWGLTAYTISVADLREALRNRKMFDGEASVFDRVRSVDVLLLDSVSVADKDERIFSLREISNLIVSRFDQGLVTVITSLESPGDWRKKGCAELSNAMHKSCVTLQVTGGNRHDQSLEGKVDILKPIAEPMPDPEKMKFLAPK